MKNTLTILIAATIGITISCSSDEKTIDRVFNDVERGVVLRTLHATNTFNFFDPNDDRFKFELGVEEQDQENGDLLSEVRIYQQFNDNTDDGADFSTDEVLIATIAKSEFGMSEFGLPTYSTEYLLSEALDFSNLDSGSYNGGDTFVYRLEAELTDGRVFSTDLGGTVSGGSFFSSPYTYTVGIKCIPVTPFSGDYELTMADSFGDGWNGAKITVTIDGVATEYTIDDGSAGSATITVADGASSLKFEFSGGDFDEEVTFSITDPFGNEAAAGGPSPPDGEIFLNICQ